MLQVVKKLFSCVPERDLSTLAGERFVVMQGAEPVALALIESHAPPMAGDIRLSFWQGGKKS